MEKFKSIPIEVKKECCELKKNGKTTKEIYEYYSNVMENPCSHSSFRSLLSRWCKKNFPDELTLEKGTYDGFIAHDATVQVSKNGQIVQAWIKQKPMDFDPELFLEAIKENVSPVKYQFIQNETCDRMLEIPLFDMHWGISYMEHYKPFLDDIIQLIRCKKWDKIVIPFGQDMFHNDSIISGITSSGRLIEKVDMKRAVKECLQFSYSMIDESIKNSNEVKILYSPGNHDRSITWMFMQVLLERYGSEIVDDSLEYRKAFAYGKNAIMVTHGDSKISTPGNLASIFAISFPNEFANATTREVHSGHLHHEAGNDSFGVMVRRLSSAGGLSDWLDKEDYVGTCKRFMLFEWSKEKLSAIHYV